MTDRQRRRQPVPEAVDPDVDLHVPQQRAETGPGRTGPVLGAIAAGGALGAAARHGLSLALPAHGAAFPWGTFLVNVSGCALIGVLMVLVSEGGRTAPLLVRPFLGVGVLGGYTTFSTYAVDVSRLLDEGGGGSAVGYLFGTVAGALVALWLAVSVTRAAVTRVAVRRAERP
ncbi:CrcB family protein [Streptomyces sp. N2-109]|uniref:Fluoride-specific ion channel FluC n=1 Tax=Streptomyces gossypii TaxID=2883101 RepID=A0ABT2JPQ3_9ACTN|nr:CrcB family protein [Streptomyces gossypii]MCT2589504.1 CrcB family protein [Streptomyces gossypii]